MAPLRHNALPDPNQGQLFTVEGVLQDTEPVRPTAIVDIADRANALTRLLGMLNEDNRASGLRQASATEPHRSKLVDRYGDNLSRVIDGSSRSKLSKDREITEKYWFARAAGLYSLERAGFAEDESRAIVASEYSDFLDNFGIGVADAKKRNSQAKTLKKSAAIINDKRSR